MRRFAILAAILGTSLVSLAQAAPPLNQFQNRLREYEDRYSPTRRTGEREEQAVDYEQETRQAPPQRHAEPVPPYHDEWDGGGYWDDGGYGCDDCCWDPCCNQGFFTRA